MGAPWTPSNGYASPNGKQIPAVTTTDSLFSDDFGDSQINKYANNWDVISGGLGAVVAGQNVSQLSANPVANLTQGAIGSGLNAGITYSVGSSALTVNMNTGLGDELWFLSTQVFAGKEDILVLLSKSQLAVQNSLFIGLVEVDPITQIPLLNPNFAADGNGASEFTNRGGAEFAGANCTAITNFQAEAIGDYSPNKAVGNLGTAGSWVTTQECLIEIDSRDITVSTTTIDQVAAKGVSASRVSSQCPNDKKLYKLLMRFRNIGTPASNTIFTIQRVIVIDNYEQRVQLSTGEGDTIGVKAVPVNVVTLTNANANTTMNGSGISVDPDNYAATDIASAAITTTTTSATISPKCTGGIAQFEIAVTAASGTNPTMDVVIQESNDGGVNWIDVYHFERITAIGNYHTPPLFLTGSKVRYVQTIGGTTPSFTRSLTRNIQAFIDNSASQVFRIYDRAVNANLLNSTTAAMRTRGCANLSLTLNFGAITTTPPAFQMQLSDDGGATWYNIGTPLAAVANSTVSATVNNTYGQLVRAIETTAGSGATLGYVCLKAF